MVTYDTAQICLNGHLVCASIEQTPGYAQKYCSECGAESLTHCPSCNSVLRGQPNDDDWITCAKVTAFCYECGKPYPWTEMKIDAVKELIELDDRATPESKELAISAIPDIIRETPRTQVATTKMKRFFSGAGKSTISAVKEILVSVVSDVVKKGLFP